jgi:hypothetical protein
MSRWHISKSVLDLSDISLILIPALSLRTLLIEAIAAV